MARDLYIVRHGLLEDHEKYGVERAREMEIADPSLSATGKEQAAQLVEFFRHAEISRIFSSPFLRCLETAAPLAEAMGLTINVELGLSESYTEFSREPFLAPISEKRKRFGSLGPNYQSRAFPKFSETLAETFARCDIVRELTAECEGNLLFMTHEWTVCGAVRALLRMSREELDLGCRSGGIFHLRCEDVSEDAWFLVKCDHVVTANR